MAPDHILAESILSAKRVCPVLAGTAQIRGTRLSMRVGRKMIRLKAPARFLTKMLDWCQGDMSLLDIENASTQEFDNRPFMDFIHALIKNGVLIDASNLLAHTARTAHAKGLPVEKDVWPHIRSRLIKMQAPVPGTISFDRPQTTPLLATLAKRRSATSFGKDALTPAQLSLMLHAAYGKCAPDTHHRTVASAGAFYRIDFHVILLKAVGSLRPGLYAVTFDSSGATHLRLQAARLKDSARLVFSPHQLHQATGMLILSADLALPALKYRSRSYPFLLLEAGGVVQNIALTAAEQNFGWRPIGGYDEPSITEFCQLASGHNVLVTGLFGALPAAASDDHASQRLEPEFSWFENTMELPFHMGMARIAAPAGQSSAFSWGRDTDATRAYDKAIAEASERHAYHCYRPGISRRARFGELPAMLDPGQLLGYRAAQYRSASFPYGAFDTCETYLWTEATSIITGASSWVPSSLVFAKDALPDAASEKPLFMATSSGCASGTSPLHAQENAVYELLERDAFMQHWLAQCGGHGISLSTLPSALQQRLDKLVAKGCLVSVQLLDLGTEPAWLCIVQHAQCHFTAIGAGAGASAAAALESALSEAEAAAYSRLQHPYQEAARPDEVAFPHDHTNLYASKRYFRKADALLKCRDDIYFEQAVLLCSNSYAEVLQKIVQKNMDVLWIDLSLPDAPTTLSGAPLYSGRALIPGLIPLTFGVDRMPLAMDKHHHAAATFPHPFP